MTISVAALYVRPDGCYSGIPGVDVWDESRDARKYPGPHPVVAHPPCQRWGKLYAGSPSVIKKTGVRKKLGDDGGCFEAALKAVRQWGGVLEHPWGSKAWEYFGIAIPKRTGGWVPAEDGFDGWTCCVEQGRYGHYARKPTLLVAYRAAKLPELEWGVAKPKYDPVVVARIGLAKAKRRGEVASKGGHESSSIRIDTPPAFRDVLVNLARSCRGVPSV